jgi:hypothetical protein
MSTAIEAAMAIGIALKPKMTAIVPDESFRNELSRRFHVFVTVRSIDCLRFKAAVI